MKTVDNWAIRHLADQCSRGHNINPLTPKGKPNPNLVLRKDGGRQCRRCTRLRTREAMRRLRALRRALEGLPEAPRVQCPTCLRVQDVRGRYRGLAREKDQGATHRLCPRCYKAADAADRAIRAARPDLLTPYEDSD